MSSREPEHLRIRKLVEQCVHTALPAGESLPEEDVDWIESGALDSMAHVEVLLGIESAYAGHPWFIRAMRRSAAGNDSGSDGNRAKGVVCAGQIRRRVHREHGVEDGSSRRSRSICRLGSGAGFRMHFH